jgi:uncharacterized SAM-binding protein YcdF (DUF218 family)
VLGGFFVFASAAAVSTSGSLSRADGIVVFSGDPERVRQGVDLLAEGYAGRLLVTGLDNADEVALARARFPALFACCVDVDAASENTAGDTRTTQRWARELRLGSLIVVTSSFHLPRALLELSHALPEVRLISFGVVGGLTDTQRWWETSESTRLLVREYGKLLGVWVRIKFGSVLPHISVQPGR